VSSRAWMPASDSESLHPHGWILRRKRRTRSVPSSIISQCRHSAGHGDYSLGGAVVDEVGEEDADGDVELEQDVEPAADPRRRDLRQEQGNGLHGRIGSVKLSL